MSLLHTQAVVLASLALLGAARSHHSGLDSSFGRDGRVLTDFGFGSDDIAFAIAIQPKGTILAAGASESGGANRTFALAQYAADGSLDPSFGTGGRVLTAFGAGVDASANAVALEHNGKAIVAAGRARIVGNTDFALARYRADGSLDARFGNGGIVLTDFGGFDGAVAIALLTNGRILVAGNSDEDFALARYNADGSLDRSFGSGGKVRTDFGGFDERAYAMALETKGPKIVVVGTSNGGFALARYNPDGVSTRPLGRRDGGLTDVGAAGGDDAAHGGRHSTRRVDHRRRSKHWSFGLGQAGLRGRFVTLLTGALDSTFGDGGVES